MQNIGFNASHSLSYTFDSLYSAYLKANHPLEYYNVALNNYVGDFERTDKLFAELSYFDIKLSSPKFKYSSNEYTMNKETNTIYKGISSIKGISKTVGELLNQLKDKGYKTFTDFIKDARELNIAHCDLLILIKLDFFTEFGKAKSLLKYIAIFQQFHAKKNAKKTFSKDKQYLVKTNIIAKFCDKETEKQYREFREMEFFEYVWSKLKQEDLPIKESIIHQLNYYGYIDIIDQTQDTRLWVVSSIELRGNNYITHLYNLNTGKQETCKIRKKIYEQTKIDKGDFILIRSFSREGKRYKDGDEWKQSTEDFENILKEYRKV